MKACILLQRNFAYIGHYLAQTLKQDYGITEYCGYVYVRKSYDFLRSQQDIHYTSLLLDQEIHKELGNEVLDRDYLDWLEREYGIPNLWPYLTVDRVMMSSQLIREYPYDVPLYSYDDLLKIVQIKARAILTFLDTEKPDFILFSVIGGVGSKLLYHIAQKKGIRTLVIHPTSMTNRYVISDSYRTFTGVNELFERFKSSSMTSEWHSQARKFVDTFRSAPKPHYALASPSAQPISRTRQLSFLKPEKLLRYSRWFVSYFKQHLRSADKNDYDYIGPWNYLRDSFKRKIRNIRGVSDLYDTVDMNEPFAFFPLHYEPEITLLLYAPYFSDQIQVIKLIARSLPINFKLYVKEHPAMVPYRTRSFYKQLKKIPNVRLINPKITSFELIDKAKLITTITSSAGWEATLLKKPVITFGDIFYNELSFIKRCITPESLPEIIHRQCHEFRYNEHELIHFIAALFADSAEIDLQYLWEREKDQTKRKIGIKPLADLLAKKINIINH